MIFNDYIWSIMRLSTMKRSNTINCGQLCHFYGAKILPIVRNRGWRLTEIIVDDASQNILPSNQTFCTSRRAWHRKVLADALVRAWMVVVICILSEHVLQMVFIYHKDVVQTLFTNCSHPLLSKRICPGCSEGCVNNINAFWRKHLIETGSEFRVIIIDKKSHSPRIIL